MSGEAYLNGFSSQGNNPEAESIDLAQAERVRNQVDKVCEGMIEYTFSLVQHYLANDAAELEMYGLADFPADKTVPIFVSPDLLEAPMVSNEPTPTLTLRLERQFEDEGEDAQQPDTLRMFIPVHKEHVYPAPLPNRELPPEMYIEVSDRRDPSLHQRYIIQRDENDISFDPTAPQHRYNVFEYESAADRPGEQVIHDSLSDQMLQRGMYDRIPVNAEVAMRLNRALTNYQVVKQKDIGKEQPPEQVRAVS